ncbi:MAG: M50 family metallopeptidase, partial [Hadesarchaea archaeon]|nr:M50 family metallopeptidase [Hadesarchaea archaeon]
MDTWQDYYDFTDNIRPGENFSIVADEKLFMLTTIAREDNENRGFIGMATISALPRSNFADPLYTFFAISYGIMGRTLFHPYSDNALIPWPLVSVLTWMFLLNFAIGMFNLLPLVPLDGGYILQGVAERASSEQTAKRVSYIFSFIVLALIIVNFVPMFM